MKWTHLTMASCFNPLTIQESTTCFLTSKVVNQIYSIKPKLEDFKQLATVANFLRIIKSKCETQWLTEISWIKLKEVMLDSNNSVPIPSNMIWIKLCNLKEMVVLVTAAGLALLWQMEMVRMLISTLLIKERPQMPINKWWWLHSFSIQLKIALDQCLDKNMVVVLQTVRIFQKPSLKPNFENKDKIEVQVTQCN